MITVSYIEVFVYPDCGQNNPDWFIVITAPWWFSPLIGKSLKRAGAMLDEGTIEANEKYFVIVPLTKHGGRAYGANQEFHTTCCQLCS